MGKPAILVTEHGKRHWSSYMISALVSVAAGITAWGTVTSSVDDYISLNVSAAVALHESESHGDIKKKVNELYLADVINRLEKLLLARCEDPSIAEIINPSIFELTQKYNDAASPTRWVDPSCAELRIRVGFIFNN